MRVDQPQLTECYVHVTHNILEYPGKHKCIISLTECYVHKNTTIRGDPGQQMHDSDSTECYVHVKHDILEHPRKHKCMINLDRERYVHVKMVIIIPRKMLIRKLQGQKLKFSLRNHTFIHLRTSGENWVAFFQVYLTVIRFSAT